MAKILDQKVDVVIPYSKDHTPKEMLDEAIESIKRQNIDTNINVIHDKENKGPAWARNKGLKKSENKFVAFLDADDVWKEEKLERQLIQLQKEKVGLCIEGEDREPEEFMIGLMSDSINSLTSSIVIDTDRTSVSFRTELERFEDHLFLIEAIAEGGVCFCEDLTVIRKHSQGLSSSGSLKLLSESRFQIAAIIEDEVPLATPYVNHVYSLAHYSKGRHHQKNGECERAIREFYYSLEYKANYKSIGATLLCIPIYVSMKIYQ